MALIDAPKFYEQLEELGEQEVRNHLASKAVYGGDKAALVEEWLRQKDQLRSDEFSSEQILLARRTTSLAEDANRIASRANTIAIIAIIIAAISTIIAITS